MAGWVDPVQAMVDSGVRMDLSYYTWGRPMFITPGNPADQAHGFITGSGLPMKFVNASGVVQNVYQQVTSIVDEQLVDLGPAFVFSQNLPAPAAQIVSEQMINASLDGGHSAIATQFHVDHYLNFPRTKRGSMGRSTTPRPRMPIMDLAALAGLHRGARGNDDLQPFVDAGHRPLRLHRSPCPPAPRRRR